MVGRQERARFHGAPGKRRNRRYIERQISSAAPCGSSRMDDRSVGARTQDRRGRNFLLWQHEQQLNWQTLRTKWRQFLDELLQKLEDSSLTDQNEKLPRNGIIVLPIDDLDLQAYRMRELLLAIRVLRHDRLAYILTGDTEGTDLALKAAFHRDFTRGIKNMSESFLDENYGIHSRSWSETPTENNPVITDFHRLAASTLRMSTTWRAHVNSETIGDVLDDLWSEIEDAKPKKFSEFLCERCTNDTIKLPFRALQNFLRSLGR